MKAAVYHGPRNIQIDTVADPVLSAPHDVIVAVNATSICGSDLHIYRGSLDEIMRPGHSRTGHELIGEVVEAGSEVSRFRVGDRITMAYSCSCGACSMCARGQTAHCQTTNKAVYGFGDAFGDMNGTHAEYMRIPHADGHAMKVPESVEDNVAITLSCNLPTALIANDLANIRPSDTVAIVGCGPTGLMCLDIAMLRRPAMIAAFDLDETRAMRAERRGAITPHADYKDWVDVGLEQTGGHGFDKVIEVVGSPESLNLSLSLVRPGGTISAVGVFTNDTFNLNLSDVFLRDISLHMNGFANVQPMMSAALLLLEQRKIDVGALITNEFQLQDIAKAFAIVHSKKGGACKVVIYP